MGYGGSLGASSLTNKVRHSAHLEAEPSNAVIDYHVAHQMAKVPSCYWINYLSNGLVITSFTRMVGPVARCATLNVNYRANAGQM